ncbi:hypothetical protein STAL104432_32565 [Streptomyces albus]
MTVPSAAPRPSTVAYAYAAGSGAGSGRARVAGSGSGPGPEAGARPRAGGAAGSGWGQTAPMRHTVTTVSRAITAKAGRQEPMLSAVSASSGEARALAAVTVVRAANARCRAGAGRSVSK